MDARLRWSTQTKPGYFFCSISNMISPISREYRHDNPSLHLDRLHTMESATTSRCCCWTRRRRSRRAMINCWRIGSLRVRQIPIPDCPFVIRWRNVLLIRSWTKMPASWRQTGSNHARIHAIRPRRSSPHLRKDLQVWCKPTWVKNYLNVTF